MLRILRRALMILGLPADLEVIASILGVSLVAAVSTGGIAAMVGESPHWIALSGAGVFAFSLMAFYYGHGIYRDRRIFEKLSFESFDLSQVEQAKDGNTSMGIAASIRNDSQADIYCKVERAFLTLNNMSNLDKDKTDLIALIPGREKVTLLIGSIEGLSFNHKLKGKIFVLFKYGRDRDKLHYMHDYEAELVVNIIRDSKNQYNYYVTANVKKADHLLSPS